MMKRRSIVWSKGGVFLFALLISTFVLGVFATGAVEVGEKAPDFKLRSTQGGEISLNQYLGKKNVVLQFYVLDFSPT